MEYSYALGLNRMRQNRGLNLRDAILKSLFGDGEQGGMYVVHPSGQVWQDLAATVIADSATDPVRLIQDESGNAVDITALNDAQRPQIIEVDGKLALRSDFADEAMRFTGQANVKEAWLNTPYGHYKTQASAGVNTAPINDMSQFIAHQGMNETQRNLVKSWFGTDEKFYVTTSPNLTQSNLRAFSDGPSTTITFIGANGVSVEKTLSTNDDSSFDLGSDGLTAPIVMVTEQPPVELTLWRSFSNQHTGPLPDISALTNLTHWFSHTNQHTGPLPDISGLTNLTRWWSRTNQHTGPLPDISALTNLTQWRSYNNQHDSWAGGTISPTCTSFRSENNALNQAAVDGILVALDNAGASNGDCRLHLGTNAAPSATGLAARDNLIARGWQVLVNS